MQQTRWEQQEEETIEGPISDLNLTQVQAADLLGVSRRFLTIDDDNPPPRNEDGSYNAQRIVAWFAARGSEIDEQIKAEKLRKLKRDNEVAERRLVDMEELRPHTVVLQDALRDYAEKIARKKNMTGQQAHAMFNRTLNAVEAKIASIANADS